MVSPWTCGLEHPLPGGSGLIGWGWGWFPGTFCLVNQPMGEPWKWNVGSHSHFFLLGNIYMLKNQFNTELAYMEIWITCTWLRRVSICSGSGIMEMTEELSSFLVNNFSVAMLQQISSARACLCLQVALCTYLAICTCGGANQVRCSAVRFLCGFADVCVLLLVETFWMILSCSKILPPS